jgi:hypothetical protein
MLVQSTKTPREIAAALYLGILSRFPTADEVTIVETYFKSPGMVRRQGTIDLAWALINSEEFLYQH